MLCPVKRDLDTTFGFTNTMKRKRALVSYDRHATHIRSSSLYSVYAFAHATLKYMMNLRTPSRDERLHASAGYLRKQAKGMHCPR